MTKAPAEISAACIVVASVRSKGLSPSVPAAGPEASHIPQKVLGSTDKVGLTAGAMEQSI